MASRRTNHVFSTASPSGSPSDVYSMPITPKVRRPRTSVIPTMRSPASTPSISSSVPFDWDAARSMKPPPYPSPLRTRPRKSVTPGTPAKKKVIKQTSWVERFTDIPSQLLLDFPQNLPLPYPRTSAFILGGSMHLLHLFIRVSQSRKVSDSDLGWEDMYREHDGTPWFDWTVPVTLLLVVLSALNVLYLLSRTRVYTLNHRTERVSSPNVSFVFVNPTEPPTPISLSARLWRYVSQCGRWLFALSPPRVDADESEQPPARRVQRLELWIPGELELSLFCLYSPAHAILWMCTGPSNWIGLLIVMCLVSAQSHVMVVSYTGLLKDKEIVAAEVMHEYNEKFVNPRLNPIRVDAAVMTHEAEVVNIWGDRSYY